MAGLYQKTIALTNAAQSLYTLLAAAFTSQDVGRQCSSFEVWGDSVLTTQDVYCGDSLVSSTNHAFVIYSGGQDKWADSSPDTNSIALTQYYLRAASGTPSVNVRVTYR